MPRLRETGFTFAEVVIVALLVSLIGAGLLTSFLMGRTSYLSADALALIQQQSRQVFDDMVRELREATTVSCGEAGTTSACTGSRLNFQIVRAYIGGAVEVGSEAAVGEFLHYIMTTTGNDAQLVRCRSSAATSTTASFGDFSGCRVLANYVNGAAGSTSFAWDDTNRTITLNLEIAYQHPVLPTGSRTTGVLTSRVRLRNPT